MESILTSIKKMLGITEEYDHFDADLIMHINSVFMILTQLGVGPSEGFRIEDELATWSDIIPADKNFEIIKSYMHLKVKMLFDPPLSSVVLGSMERMISEFEWRINVLAEQMAYDPPKPIVPDKPVEDTKVFEVEDVSINERNVVLQYKGLAPKDVPSLETSITEGNIYVTNNGNYDLNFSLSKSGMLQVSDEANIPEEEPEVIPFEVNAVSIEGNSITMDYEGEAPHDVPYLETNLSEGNIYVTNNGNYDLNFSLSKSGMLQVSDEAGIPEEEFVVNTVSMEDNSVVISYEGDMPNDIPSMEVSLLDGNLYVENNGNYELNFTTNNGGMLQVSDEANIPEEEPEVDTNEFAVESISVSDHDVILNYTGEAPNDIPLLENSLTDGNMYVSNNGNYNIYLSQNNGLLHYSDGVQNNEAFNITNVSLENGSVAVDYEGECAEAMPTLTTSFEEGNGYVNDNGNNNLMFSVNNTKELEVNY